MANTVPSSHKLCSRVSHIWGNRRGRQTYGPIEEKHPRDHGISLPGKLESFLFNYLVSDFKLWFWGPLGYKLTVPVHVLHAPSFWLLSLCISVSSVLLSYSKERAWMGSTGGHSLTNTRGYCPSECAVSLVKFCSRWRPESQMPFFWATYTLDDEKYKLLLSNLIRGNNRLIHILASLPPSTQWWQEVTDTLPTPSLLWLKLCVSMLSHNHVLYWRHAFSTPAFGSVTVSFSKHNSMAIAQSYLSTKLRFGHLKNKETSR